MERRGGRLCANGKGYPVENLMECTENIRVRRALLTGDRQPSIRDQLKAAQREALEHQGPEAPKKKAPDRGER